MRRAGLVNVHLQAVEQVINKLISYFERLDFQYSSLGLGSTYGQNIYATTSSNPVSANVVNFWASDAANYNYASNTCAAGKICGDYTQIVWRSSLNLGCGISRCTTGSPWGTAFPTWTIVVCNYSPTGNYMGLKPY